MVVDAFLSVECQAFLGLDVGTAIASWRHGVAIAENVVADVHHTTETGHLLGVSSFEKSHLLTSYQS